MCLVMSLMLVVCSMPAWAQPDPGKMDGPGAGLQAADANNDGKITAEEHRAFASQMAEKRFQKMDVNNDGVITEDEMPMGRKMRDRGACDPAQCADRIKAADTNKDGKVTQDEASAVCPQVTKERFEQLDANKDGSLSVEEAAACPKVCGMGGGDQPWRERFREKLQQADTDGDGKVTLEEAKASCPRMVEDKFQRWDKDGDGVLTMDEIDAAGPRGRGNAGGKAAQ